MSENIVNLEESGEIEEVEDSKALGAHYFSLATFSKFTYCSHCQSFIYGLKKQGYKCQACRFVAHTDCLDKVDFKCYIPEIRRGYSGSQLLLEHHWVSGNIQRKSKCLVCLKTIKTSAISKTDFKSSKCSSCKLSVHNECIDSAPGCVPIHRRSLLCPDILKIEFKSMDQYSKWLTYSNPLLVFVNKKSGGREGNYIIKKLRRHLIPTQIISLHTKTVSGLVPISVPYVLEQFNNIPNLQILVCGGDGTINWVLNSLDKVEFIYGVPNVSILPIGTANDLSRYLKWGTGFAKKSGKISDILKYIEEETQIVSIDRWKLTIMIKNLSDDIKNFKYMSNVVNDNIVLYFTNYFSVGIDAKITYQFHEARENNPQLFQSRILNMGVYGSFGVQAIATSPSFNLSKLKLFCDDQEIQISDQTAHSESLVFSNIPSYSGGIDLWGKNAAFPFVKSEANDGILEVVTIKNAATLVALQTHVSNGDRLTQGTNFEFEFPNAVEIQVDGEPFLIPPAIFRIQSHRQFNFLQRKKT